MNKISEIELEKELEKRMTRLKNKDVFWLDLKNNTTMIKSNTINEQNLLIDMPNKIQRDNFVKKFQELNPSYDYFTDSIPDKYKEEYKKYFNNEDCLYPCFGIPLFVAKISNISSIKDIYIGILKSFNVGKSDLRIKNLEEMEHRISHVIETLSIEIILINYDGEKLIPSKNLFSVLYALCRLSELCKISFNLFGSISPKVFYSESRKVPVGNFYCIDGENNSNDVHFVTTTLKLDEESGKFVKVKDN